jgi:DNA helicase-2/ATP-dependent DNA helicase PcrA
MLPPLTPELLAALGREMGGCDFSDPHQQAFLASLESCDVQAAPGNGKTTLLVAKLALLSRNWIDRSRGVCVVSHTNAAREEVQRKLGAHPTAFSFLAYPHFIGTVTAFIDQFIAIPYLRGLGWPLRRIDDDAFASAAKALVYTKPKLRAMTRQNGGAYRVEKWACHLQLANDFVVGPNGPPERLRVCLLDRQPGSHTDSGRELEEIKAALVNRGLYRYGDMMVLARRAIANSPHLIARLRARFPIVLLDEAQDTHGEQLAMLHQLFGEGTVFQRLGDQNQTLYVEPGVDVNYWQPAEHLIPLDSTRRFGPDIATFASRLTARISQVIVGADNRPGHRLLLTFDRPSISEVLPRYARWAADHLPDGGRNAEILAVASRHNLYRDARGEWPKSLVDYHPPYRSGEGQGTDIASFCGALRKLARAHGTGRSPAESQVALAAVLVDYLERHGVAPMPGERLTTSNVWKTLANGHPERPLLVRKLVIEHVLRGGAAFDAHLWEVFCAGMLQGLGLEGVVPEGDYCQFLVQGVDEGAVDTEARARACLHGVNIRLGSIHSVKGQTADAVLVVETEVWRGPGREQRAMDLATVLPHAFGLENRDFSTSEAALAAATNVFVGVTRPKSMLALGVRHDALPAGLLDAARAQGWAVIDVRVP